jgi:hypothetical protein
MLDKKISKLEMNGVGGIHVILYKHFALLPARNSEQILPV